MNLRKIKPLKLIGKALVIFAKYLWEHPEQVHNAIVLIQDLRGKKEKQTDDDSGNS